VVHCGWLDDERETRGEAPVSTAATDDDLRSVRAVLREEVAARRPRGGGPRDAAPGLLWDEVARLADGGKHLRARLLLDLHRALAGTRRPAAVRAAAALEMLHAAFLLHDDLIDGDLLRRGRPNLLAVARDHALARGLAPDRARRWADVACLLAGDVALGLAHHLMATVDAPHGLRAELQELLSTTVVTTVHGELGDVALELGVLEPDDAAVLGVARAKTAMYTFRAPARAAGLLAGADDGALSALDRAGRRLGEAFQLVDDVRGALAAPQVTGKPASDLGAAKVTLLVLEARRTPGWEDVAPAWGAVGPGDERLRAFLVESGAVGRVCARVEGLLTDVTRGADRLPPLAAAVLVDAADELRLLLAEVGSAVPAALAAR
jgi:geranylgeranyl diphosphate synthase type II